MATAIDLDNLRVHFKTERRCLFLEQSAQLGVIHLRDPGAVTADKNWLLWESPGSPQPT